MTDPDSFANRPPGPLFSERLLKSTLEENKRLEGQLQEQIARGDTLQDRVSTALTALGDYVNPSRGMDCMFICSHVQGILRKKP